MLLRTAYWQFNVKPIDIPVYDIPADCMTIILRAKTVKQFHVQRTAGILNYVETDRRSTAINISVFILKWVWAALF